MKQGNSENDQTPDFVCFRTVVNVQGQPPEFRMFSKKIRIFEGKKSDFREKIWIFDNKKIGFSRKIGFSKQKVRFLKKIQDFVFPNVS